MSLHSPFRYRERVGIGPRDNGVFTWLVLILLATVFEGAIRKWFAPSSLHPFLYGMKDVLALIFIFRHPVRTQSPLLRSLRTTSLLMGVILVPALVVGIFTSTQGAILTYKNAVFWPLFATYAAECASLQVWRRLALVLAVIGIGVATLSSIQALSPANAVINAYAWDSYGVTYNRATFGTYVRASGTFSYLSGLAQFSGSGMLGLFWHFLLRQRTSGASIVIALGSFGMLVCGIASGSRAALSVMAMGIIGGLWASRRIGVLARCFVVGSVCATLYLTFVGTTIVDAFVERTTSASDRVGDRVASGGWDFVAQILSDPIGEGLGTSSQDVNLRASVMERAVQMNTVEDGRSRLAGEAGFLSVIILILTASVPLRLSFRSFSGRDISSRIAGGVFGCVCLYITLSGVLWYDHVASAMWWLLLAQWMTIVESSRTFRSLPAKIQWGRGFRQADDRLLLPAGPR